MKWYWQAAALVGVAVLVPAVVVVALAAQYSQGIGERLQNSLKYGPERAVGEDFAQTQQELEGLVPEINFQEQAGELLDAELGDQNEALKHISEEVLKHLLEDYGEETRAE